MLRTHKFLTTLVLLSLVALTFATPVQAFDGRSGDKIVIAAGEVVNDDLYVSAGEFILYGTVKGDLVVAGGLITINGTVEGDVIAAGQAIIINGKVEDDARVAGAALQVSPNAQIGDDLVFAGASLENKSGSTVGGDVIVGSAQTLLAGDVAGNVMVGTGRLELRGTVGGDVQAYVQEPGESYGPPQTFYMPSIPITMPSVATGLTIAPEARISGNLEYTSTRDLSFPANAIIGKITRIQPEIDVEAAQKVETPAQKVLDWFLKLVRMIVTLILIGLLLGWLFPKFVKTAAVKLQSKPWLSFGWGVVNYAAVFFAGLVILIAMIMLVMFFGFLTLGQLTGITIWIGLLTLFVLITGFILAAGFIAKIVVSDLLGKLILARLKPDWAEHKVWPLVIGVLIVSILITLPWIGWLLKLAAILFGLGALWIFGRERLAKQPVV